jgi:hypothetical protein
MHNTPSADSLFYAFTTRYDGAYSYDNAATGGRLIVNRDGSITALAGWSRHVAIPVSRKQAAASLREARRAGHAVARRKLS